MVRLEIQMVNLEVGGLMFKVISWRLAIGGGVLKVRGGFTFTFC